ncbi:LacI family DNA-binding transcriptional regulator [Microbacterium sp. HD4P20]|uniref:LacI family DNA-binding transcriptional regulator n=1 Tax=Microbacterium sp. HD4P20 TaxID=2864874 RepID=UPI001C63C9D2|nr:LacI family DNA-binding transcriptional regulator [Microbacterium sp. HD4P20]MCP2638201.1 LacI family DNA-binding transcriptional regulator [Microbacterium sp. HD4P20]
MTEVRLSDVARAAGVSEATASRVLNGSTRRVRPQHAELVREAAARLGYSVDLRAQATARRSSTTVAIVVPSLTDEYVMRAAAEAHSVAEDLGYAASVTVWPPGDERAAAIIRRLRGQRPRAIFLVAVGEEIAGDLVSRELEQFRVHGGVVALIDDTRRPHTARPEAREIARSALPALAERTLSTQPLRKASAAAARY